MQIEFVYVQDKAELQALRKRLLGVAKEANKSFYMWLRRAKLEPHRQDECLTEMFQRAETWVSARERLKALRAAYKKHGGTPFHVQFNTPL